MNFRGVIGKTIIVVGVLFVIYSSVLFVENQLDEKNAKEFSADVATQLLDEIEDDGDSDNTSENISDDFIDDSTQGGDTISIDGNLYIGVLEIPSLNLVLPIQSEWSYAKLRNTPCVYESSPLIIAAHNYDAHFGRIGTLKIGSEVKFTTADSEVYYFEVLEVEMLDGTDVFNMVETEYDMTLFTCNYNDNTERVAVRLNLIEEEEDVAK